MKAQRTIRQQIAINNKAIHRNVLIGKILVITLMVIFITDCAMFGQGMN
jgi:hypothetical protein